MATTRKAATWTLRAVVSVTIFFVFVPAAASESEQMLMETIFRGYDRKSRPTKNNTDKTTHVSIGIALNQIIDLNERDQMLKISLWFRVAWHDYRMTWNSSDFDRTNSIRVGPERLWMPDILLLESIDDNQRSDEVFATTPVIVDESGSMYWLTPVVANVFCYVDIRAFPFDHQEVVMTIASWAHSNKEIDLQPRPGANDSAAFIGNGGWDLQYFTVESINDAADTTMGLARSVVRFKLGIKRRPLFHLYYSAIPCMIIVYIAIQVFCLPPESGEKMTLAITMVLSMTMFLLMIAESTPPTSIVIPMIGKFFGMSMILLAISATFTVYVLHIANKDEYHDHVPRWLSTITLVWMAKVVGRSKLCKSVLEQVRQAETEAKVYNQRIEEFRAEEAVLRNIPMPQPTDDDDDTNPFILTPPHQPLKTSRSKDDVIRKSFRTVKSDIRNIKETFYRKTWRTQLKCMYKTEWFTVAMVIDRLLFGVFVVSGLIAGLIIFLA